VFDEILFDDDDFSLLKNGTILIQKNPVFNKTKNKEYSSEIYLASFVGKHSHILTINNLDLSKYSCKFCLRTTRMIIDENFWIDTSSWVHKGKEYIYNTLNFTKKDIINNFEKKYKIISEDVLSKYIICIFTINPNILENIFYFCL